MKNFSIISPFDAHVHFRNGNMAKLVVPMSTKQFSDCIVMPNLNPPVTTVAEAIKYQTELLSIANCNYHMALYLTEATKVEEVKKAAANPNIIGFKLYPLNATTGSDSGISDINNVYHLFEAMEECEVPLMIHGEVTNENVDIFQREKIFIGEILAEIVDRFPNLRITLEHITTDEAVNFVMTHDSVVASITIHHLLINRNAIFTVNKKTALNPHNFCLPIAKTEFDRQSLLDAAFSGNPSFFAGTDSAPHHLLGKESCGCAGCFTGSHAVELYATVFDQGGKLDLLENFLSIHGRSHYGIEIPNRYLELAQVETTIPKSIELPRMRVPIDVRSECVSTIDERNFSLIPFWAGRTLNWKVIGETSWKN